jgi:hypothetical protein
MRSRLTNSQVSFVREFMAIRREVSKVELERLPSVRDMADRMNLSLAHFYRVASGVSPKPVRRRDVPRGTLTIHSEASP